MISLFVLAVLCWSSVILFFFCSFVYKLGYKNRERKAELAHEASRKHYEALILKEHDEAYARGYAHGVETERERIREFLGE